MKISANEIKNRNLCEGQIGIFYLGQEGYLVKSQDKYLVVDPYLSYYVDKNCSQIVNWERLYAPPIEAEELSFINVVVCTHSHYDHADPETLSKIAKANPETVFVVPAPVKKDIAAYGISEDRIIEARDNETISVCGFEITPIPSAHEDFHTDENGDYCELGYIIEAQGQRFFHAGDMCMYDGLIEKLKNIDIAFLPINGRDYFRTHNDIIGNFDCVEAVTLAKEIGAKMLVPMHHDLYAVNCVNPTVFINAINEIDKYRRFHIFSPAECYISIK